jgi:hypothetical protein
MPANVHSAIVNNATAGRLNSLEICVYNPRIDDYICSNTSPNLLLYSGFIAPPASNPIDDTRFFTRQLYYDFLRRTPDQGGWDGWTNYINECGTDSICLQEHRAGTVRGFIESTEFLNTHATLRNSAFGSQAYNEEYIRQLYLALLQREPEPAGFAVQLNYINTHPGDYSGLVRGFIYSDEYLFRFY